MVGIYVRLSDEDNNKRHENDESESIQNQKLLLKDYCGERNWQIYDIYVDEDYSGTNFNRPDFQRLLRDCEMGFVDTVLCKTQSRFSRDMSVIETYLHDKFVEWGVRFVSVVDHADTDDTRNKKTRQINGLINEWYCEEVSENVRKVLKNKRQNGQFTGSFPPYGYLIDPDDKNHLVVDKDIDFVVRDIFEMYLKGYGYRKIVMELNARNIPSPTEQKRRQNAKYVNPNELKSVSKGLWTQSSIYTILRNEIYTGTLTQGKSHTISYKNKKRQKVPSSDWIRVPDCHEAIVSFDVFDKVREKLSCRLRSSRVTTELTPLAGKVRCAVCGAPMKRDVSYNKARTKMYYSLYCGTYKNGACNCSNTSGMSGSVLEKTIVDEINRLIDNYCNIDEMQIVDNRKEQIASLQTVYSQNEVQIENIKSKVASLYEDKLDGTITKEQYISYSKKYNKDIESLTNTNLTYANKIKQLGKMSEEVFDKRDTIEKHAKVEELNREVVTEFIDTIKIGEPNAKKSRKIEIIWNF